MKKLFSKFRLSRIRIKLFAVIFVVLTVLLAMITVFSTPVLFRAFSFRTYRDLVEIASGIDNLIPESASYYFDLYSISVNNNVSFEIIGGDGSLLYTSTTNSAHGSDHFASSGTTDSEYSRMHPSDGFHNPPELDNFEILRRDATNAEYFVYTHTLKTSDTLHIYSEVANVENTVSVSGGVYSLMSITMIFIMSVIFYLLIAKFTKPLVKMNEITKDMAALNFERKCEDYGNDEIGELGNSINTLSTTLNSTLIDLKDKNEQLEKDIERRHALDNARSSFISNVSHELKTPIAIISGYAEGLCEGISEDPEVIKEYCQIIHDESRKMNALVVELLELSKLENRVQPFTPDYFDIGACILSLTGHLSLQFEQKGITLVNKIPASLVCYAQEDKIEIVLKNYITNAMSHCEGEKIIELDYTDKGSLIEISVFNTGKNIEKHDLPEIWDSFYRADKAHGRSENRFGLGLSIVKSIMANHNCNYGVKNTENGVVFTFEVSKDSEYYDNKEQ